MRTIKYTKTCPVCGADFETERSYAKYCSRKCYNTTKHRKRDAISHRLEAGAGTAYVKPKRRCHDCGRPTSNYRCEECWSKVRKGAGQ